ncbi:hypothetical protein Ais01nite_52490 [Asanoa ishikariensis]|nr:hypothetical protein Ais01nite_52490 [Asanoa ishikariensis]
MDTFSPFVGQEPVDSRAVLGAGFLWFRRGRIFVGRDKTLRVRQTSLTPWTRLSLCHAKKISSPAASAMAMGELIYVRVHWLRTAEGGSQQRRFSGHPKTVSAPNNLTA